MSDNDVLMLYGVRDVISYSIIHVSKEVFAEKKELIQHDILS